jgi:agmatinase
MQLQDFNPNAIGNTDLNIFGLPFNTKNANIIIIPVPWEVTTSYRRGTANAPRSIFDASFQVDLFDPFKKDAWKTGFAMAEIPGNIKRMNEQLSKLSSAIVAALEKGVDISKSPELQKKLKQVNTGCCELNDWVNQETQKHLNKNKLIAMVGGDHSVPLGYLQTLSEKHNNFGILQIDAHADLRKAYEGFEFSHASIMFNALKIPQISKLVQLGIRDYCEEEFILIGKNNKRISTFFERDIRSSMYEGVSWKNICKKIIAELPQKIYISFDIDGLDPKLCPNTGTPVPGGFELQELYYLFEMIAEAGKKIIGFDLCETGISKNEWDENVAARILYKLANVMAKSNKL